MKQMTQKKDYDTKKLLYLLLLLRYVPFSPIPIHMTILQSVLKRVATRIDCRVFSFSFGWLLLVVVVLYILI